MMRVDPDLSFEKNLWQNGIHTIVGLDEAGRGALAGPVAVGAVILPIDPNLSSTLSGVRDSKQMTRLSRDAAAGRIQEIALACAVGFSSADEIDSLGIVPATRLAALRALENISITPDFLLTDFRLELPELDISQAAIVKGDAKCLSIACASVLAKTARDALMRELDARHPGYQLGKHKGYGTQIHRLALKRLGYSSVHRKTFVLKK
jgi:ribonuclease HII